MATLSRLRSPLITCWPVPTEVAWLLRKEPKGLKAIGDLVRSGSVMPVELDDRAFLECIAFMERYASAGVQLADAAPMSIAEREGVDTAFTPDVRDSSVYRKSDGRALVIVPEP